MKTIFVLSYAAAAVIIFISIHTDGAPAGAKSDDQSKVNRTESDNRQGINGTEVRPRRMPGAGGSRNSSDPVRGDQSKVNRTESANGQGINGTRGCHHRIRRPGGLRNSSDSGRLEGSGGYPNDTSTSNPPTVSTIPTSDSEDRNGNSAFGPSNDAIGHSDDSAGPSDNLTGLPDDTSAGGTRTGPEMQSMDEPDNQST